MSERNAELARLRPALSVRGQSLVEFALILPIFLVIVLAAVDFGWALRSFITATNAAREGARLGVVGASATEITTKTVESSSGVLSAGDVSVSGAGGAPGSTVTVSVAYDYHYITPLGGLISLLTGGSLPSPLPFSTSTTMRIE
jgi:Flp pilus assembly protein TadG